MFCTGRSKVDICTKEILIITSYYVSYSIHKIYFVRMCICACVYLIDDYILCTNTI